MEVAEKLASEFVLSNSVGTTLRKWRNIFELSQRELAAKLKISPSVISDYESGRRKAPSVKTAKKIVEALAELGIAKGKISKEEVGGLAVKVKDFLIPVRAKDFIRAIGGMVIAGKNYAQRYLHGCTILDSLKTITSLNSSDYLKIYSYSTERALIFTGVKYGRSPMVAIRAHPLKPALVVYQKPKRVDKLALELSELERIPLVVTELSLENIISKIEKFR
ncbi:MAG: helix-turn-helix domain-containing protein [Candidatus Thermoplasmatota archaeon]|nr:helix-turn-helix domain-containing protein [Candidatus Thermoplasmatota archaeon]